MAEDLHNKELVSNIKKGKIFIFPTDAGYCIGCNALKKRALAKLEQFGNIELLAPSKAWIKDNFVIKKNYLERLHGSFIYVLKPKKKAKLDKLHKVRLISHHLLNEAKVPIAFAETGVRELKNVPKEMAEMADFVINAGRLEKAVISVVDLSGKIPKIVLKR